MNGHATTSTERASPRRQRTIRQPAEIRGIGFFTGADVTMRLLPAAENHGRVFQRVDLPQQDLIPATIENTVPRQRRTAVAVGGAVVEMTEHVLAALYGLRIDNCLIQLNAPEPPGCDGSAQRFVDALLNAEIVEQHAPQMTFRVDREYRVAAGNSEVTARPLARDSLAIGYQLDYGPQSPIRPQILNVEITAETFVAELAFARTFVLESEVEALRAQGFGLRVTEKELLVFGPDGVIGNRLRTPDECVRHKILDCLGDFALLGCDLFGQFNGYRSGHQLNRELIGMMDSSGSALSTETHSRSA